jgi:hypothetical protein
MTMPAWEVTRWLGPPDSREAPRRTGKTMMRAALSAFASHGLLVNVEFVPERLDGESGFA